MICNHKKRPDKFYWGYITYEQFDSKRKIKMWEAWAKGQEKELREWVKSRYCLINKQSNCHAGDLAKEILGE